MENKLSMGYQEAIALHNQILDNGNTAATYIFEMARCLKRMRDEKLYKELNYSSFEDYSEQMAHIKQRQAYKYISTYERFGEKFMVEHGNLGITKLELLAQIPATELDEFTAENNPEDISVRELRELTEKFRNQGEQLSLLETENAQLKAEKEETDTAQDEIDALKAEIEKLQRVDPDEKQLDKIRKEAEKAAKAKVKADMDSANKAAEEKMKKAVAEAESKTKAAQAEKQSLAEQMQAITAERTAAEERAKKAEKELQLKSSATTQEFMIHLDYLKNAFNRLVSIIPEECKQNPGNGEKLAKALKKMLDVMMPAVDSLQAGEK